MYRRETAATEAEFIDGMQRVRTDPDEARAMLLTLYSLSVEDPAFVMLLRLFVEGAVMKLIEDRAEQDDAFALHCGGLIADLMTKTRPVPRGKPRSPAKSA